VTQTKHAAQNFWSFYDDEQKINFVWKKILRAENRLKKPQNGA
jgi:hypothetical protein